MNKVKQAGFTLLELLVVISIIGMLSSVVTASLNRARLKSRDARRIADMKQLYNAMQISFNNNGTLPRCSDPGYVGGCETVTISSTTGLVDTSLNGNYLEFLKTQGLIAKIPVDPINNSNNFYMYARGEFPSGSGVFYNFFIATILEDPNNPALLSDFDTGLSGVGSVYILADRQ